MLFTQLFESDFNKKPTVESVDDYEDCSYCSGTGEGRWEGSTCTHCDGSGVEPVSQDDDDFEEPDDVADIDQDEESYYEKSLRSRGLGEEAAGKFQLPGVGSWLNVGQQQQATDDTPGNFSIVVAGRQGKDFQAITLAKALETILPKDYPRSGWPNTPGSDRSPTHYVIQEVLNRGQAVVKDGIGSKDVADSIAVKFKKYGIPAYVEGALEEGSMVEGTQTVGHEILGMLRQVRRQGHDAMEELYSSCPLLAQYWDEYEGDFRSMVIELSPETLTRIKAEISAFNQQGVAEGKYKCTCHPGDADPDCPVHGLEPMDVGDALDVKKGVAEARAATARFRTGNKKRAELNAMSDEERRAYDKEQQEKQRKRDDARLERERQKLAAKKKVAENSLNELSPGLLQRAAQVAKVKRDQALNPEVHNALGGGYMNPLSKHYDAAAEKFSDRATKIKQRDAVKKIASPAVLRKIGMSGVTEADKKKEEPNVKDVGLQRAISKAKGDFPTAGSGLEALAKDFMRSQNQDQQSFDQIRQTERQQNQMLKKINQIDQAQDNEIQDLEKENSTLTQRLQKLQSVNSELEKKLSTMSGRKQKRKDDSAPTIASTTPSEPTATPVSTSTNAPEPAVEPSKSKAIGQMTKALSPPSNAIDQMAQQLQPRQKELPLGEPVTLKPKKFDTSRAADIDYKELTSKLAKDIAGNPAAAQAYNPGAVRSAVSQQEMPVETKNKSSKSEPPEVNYDDEFDAMVSRVGKLAKEGPRKTVWDPVKRVYKTVPVNAPVKQGSNK